MADEFEFGVLEQPRYLVETSGSAEERLASLRADAELRGYEEGLARGQAEARARTEQALEALDAAATALAGMRDEYLAEAEQAAVEFALQIAEKVIGAVVETDPQTVLDVVAGALLRTTDRDHLVVEVNPADFELVRDAAADVAARLGGIRRIEVVSERRVDRGGCVVRTVEGEIDAGIESQLQRVRELVAEVRGARGRPGGPERDVG